MEDTTTPEWTLKAGLLGRSPAVLRLRSGAFVRDLGNPAYSTAVVVQIALNDPNDEGLPGAAEGNELRDVELVLRELVGDRAMLVSVITAHGLRQYTWYGSSPEWAPELLAQIDTRISSHGMRVLAHADPQWRVARQLIDEDA
ncbi:MAG TPA: DUF695 domain-containing protein [Acidimicrobiia bacterium]|jgi:hypothetical protein|nr:DUF695 domain-containing protein [Acidimicrobiia bacterium]